jgi:ribonuclease HII
MAGVAVCDPDLPGRLGCTDSKKLSPDRRRALDRALRAEGKEAVRIEVRAVSAEEMDRRRRAGASLTDLEVEGFQSIARALGARGLYVDAAHVDEAAFAELLRPALPAGTLLVSEHKADATYPVVGAASIVAKVERDAAIEQLARRLQRRLNLPLGSGYPSDPLTRAFLAAWWREFGDWPEGTRTTWATVKDLMAPQPTRLDRFV